MVIKKTLLLFIFVGIIPVFFSASCKKNKATVYLHSELKAYLDFKPGSYWIYKDTTTNQEDSVYVYNYGTAVLEDEKTKIPFEGIDYKLNWKGKEILVNLLSDFNKEPRFYHAKYLIEDNNTCCISDPLFALTKDGIPSGDIYLGATLEYFDTLKTNNTSYTSVYKYTSPYDGYNYIKSAYIKKNTGIVRIDFQDSTVYELIKYHVVQ